MAVSFWLSDAQMARIEPFLPLSHGIARVVDRRVLSGIIPINSDVEQATQLATPWRRCGAAPWRDGARAVPRLIIVDSPFRLFPRPIVLWGDPPCKRASRPYHRRCGARTHRWSLERLSPAQSANDSTQGCSAASRRSADRGDQRALALEKEHHSRGRADRGVLTCLNPLRQPALSRMSALGKVRRPT